MKLRQTIIFLLIILFLRGEYLASAHDPSFFLYDSSCNEHINEALPKIFMLRKVIVNADVVVDRYELLTLLTLAEGRECSSELLMQGIEHLKRKQKFSAIKLAITHEKCGYTLAFTFEAMWTLRRTVIKGSFPYKERYQRFYHLTGGDPFDVEHHNEALDEFKKALHDDGYCSLVVKDSLTYRSKTKEVDVVLVVDGHKQFDIDTVVVKSSFEGCSEEQSSLLQQECKEYCTSRLQGALYTRQSVEEVLGLLRRHLQAEGCTECDLDYTLLADERKSKVALTCTIKAQKRKKYVFCHNAFFDAQQLLDVCVLYGSSVPFLSPLIVAEEVTDLYRKFGFLNCNVTWTEDEASFVIAIHEGERVKIKDIFFEGLHPSLVERAKNYYSQLLGGAYYDSDILESCTSTLTNFFLTKGYWDFSLTDFSFKDTQNSYAKTLVLTCNCGNQRLLQALVIEGAAELSTEGPFKNFYGMTKPRPFNVHWIKEQQAYLNKHLQKKGYLYTSYQPEFQQGEQGLILCWKLVGTKDPVVFGRTIIVGSNGIPAHVLLRELAYKPGESWNPDKIHASVSNLKTLSIFENISLGPADLFRPEESKTMILKVVEDDPYELRARGGLGFIGRNIEIRGGATYRLGATFLWKNPAQYGDVLRADADINRYTSSVSLLYQLPWFWIFPVKTAFKVYSSHYEQPFIVGSPDILYNAIHRGGAIRLQSRRTFYEWGLNAGIEWMEIDGLSKKLASVLRFEPNLIDQSFPFFVCEPTLFVDTLDNKITPRSGTLSIITLRAMFPFTLPDAWYVKILAEHAMFTSPFGPVVWGCRLRFGHIFHAPFERIMPTERFYLGGAWSLRGYEPDHAPPLNTYFDGGGKEHLVPIGGKSLLNINLECRFPLYRELGGVIFTDLGALSQNSFAEIRPESILGATGFGLRYDTSVGSVRMDIGFKWKKRFEGDSAVTWFFTLGQAF